MNTTCCKIHDKNAQESSKISATDSASNTSRSSSTTTIIATTDTTTCRNNNNNNNPCSNNAIGSNGGVAAILRANNDNNPNYYGDSSSSSSSNNVDGDKNRDMDITNRVVGQIKIKKEEIKDMQQHDNNNNNNNNNLDNNYAGWEVGSWCWLLPTAKDKGDITNTTDKKRKQKQCEDGNDVNYGDPAAAAGNNASIRNDDGIYKDKDNDNEEEPMKKKMRINDDDEEEEKNNEHHKTDTAATTTTTTPINDSIKDKNNGRDNNDNDGYESWTKGNWCWLLPADCSVELKRSKSDNNTGQINSSSSSNSSSKDDDDDDDDDELVIKRGGKSGNDGPREEDISDQDDDDDGNDNDGYESWTIGNWCWILPPSSDDAMIEETEKHRRTGVVLTVNETTNSRFPGSPRCRRRCSSSSVRPILDGDNENGDDNTYNDDDFENNSNSGRINSNTGKITMSYHRWQNELWHEMYQRLVTYKKQHHDSTNVPRKYKADPKLGHWVMTQRKMYRKNEISEERINYLKSIGFVWKIHSVVPWDEMFQRLVTYKKKFKSTVVPWKYPYLGIWVHTQRTYYNKKEVSVKRINLLESIGFVWNPRDEQWMEMYQKLVTYKKQHRSTKMPKLYTDDPQLHSWLMHQRQVYNNKHSGSLTKKRLELLNSINFNWSVK